MPLVTLADFARHRGVSRAAVTLAVKSGRITRRPDGKLDLKTANREWEQNTDATKPRSSAAQRAYPSTGRSSSGKTAPPRKGENHEPRNLSEAIFRKERARAQKAELELRIAEGALVRASDVSKAVFEAHRRARDLMMGYPIQLANVLAAVSDPNECLRILEQAFDRIAQSIAAPTTAPRKKPAGQ